ncbi:hypothetical protein BDC45DRAFT_345359 [Circinella umbellata]|nr:hypothetical protein BDC45DRAFT_345359 [Circinella umbellata]
MRQGFQDGFHQSVFPLATAVSSSSVPMSSPITSSSNQQQLSQSSDVMDECNDSSPPRTLESDEYEDEFDTSGDDQSDHRLSPRRQQQQQQHSPRTTSPFSPSSSATPPQALFLNFTSDLEPHVNMKASNKSKKAPAFKLNGVNLLNRKNVDSKTAIERIQRRRENHNHVERRRRDNINNTIFELSRIVPNAVQQGQKLNKGKVLKMALDHILELQRENELLKERRGQPNDGRTAGNLTLSEGVTKHGDSIPQSGGCGTTTAIRRTSDAVSINTDGSLPVSLPTHFEQAELVEMDISTNINSSSGVTHHHHIGNGNNSSNSNNYLSNHVISPSAPSPSVHQYRQQQSNSNNSMEINPQQHFQHSLSLPNSPLAGPMLNMTLPPLHASPMPFIHHSQQHPTLHAVPSTNSQEQSVPRGIRHQTELDNNISPSSTSSNNVLPPLQYEKLYNGTCKF